MGDDAQPLGDVGVQAVAERATSDAGSPAWSPGGLLSARSELRTLWNLLRTGATVLLVLVVLFFGLEVIRAYLTLRELNPLFAYGFVAFLALVAIWAVWRLHLSLRQFPTVLSPPHIADWDSPTLRELEQYLAYLRKFADQLGQNPVLGVAEQQKLGWLGEELSKQIESVESQDELNALRIQCEDRLNEFLDQIDRKAKIEVSTCVRDVMLGVMLSPYRSADLLIVLHRNARMVVRIVHLYNARPALREQFRIMSDVVSIMATVNLLNFGEKFIENLVENVPLVSKVTGDVAQGMGAGIMTSAAGDTAVQRCRAFRGWNKEDAQRSLSSKTHIFFEHVGLIYDNDVKRHIRTISAEVADAATSALEHTRATMENFVVAPVVAGSAAVASGTARGGTRLWRLTKSGGGRAWSATKQLGQRTAAAPTVAYSGLRPAGRRLGGLFRQKAKTSPPAEAVEVPSTGSKDRRWLRLPDRWRRKSRTESDAAMEPAPSPDTPKRLDRLKSLFRTKRKTVTEPPPLVEVEIVERVVTDRRVWLGRILPARWRKQSAEQTRLVERSQASSLRGEDPTYDQPRPESPPDVDG
jgi:hypothetical protein